VIARPLIATGLSCGAMALWMIYDSKIGKIRERETYLNKIHWNGHERVLDVGVRAGIVSHRRGQTALDRPRRRHRQMAAGRSQRQQRSGHVTQRDDRSRRR